VDSLIVKDFANLNDMNLQHPELIPLLISFEPQLKENEWIQIRGLMSRSNAGENNRVSTIRVASP
jgi:hypothetical protein